LFILTAVEKVYLDYGKPTARPLDTLSVREARSLLASREFPAGSMGPKIEAAIEFLRDCKRGDARVVICDIEHMAEAVAGRSGTLIEPGP